MGNIKKVKQSKKKQPATPLSTYQKLVKDIEKKKKRNEKLDKDLSTLFQRFEKEIAPIFLETEELNLEILDRLISHVEKKSLSQWQRDELFNWIDEKMQFISNSSIAGSEKSQEVFQRFNEYSEKARGSFEDINEQTNGMASAFIKEMIESELGIDVEEVLEKEDYEDFIKNPEKFMKEKAHIFNEFLEDKFEEQAHEYAQAHHEKQKEQEIENKKLFKDTAIDKLYKKLAKVLHPDTKSDEAEKEKLHELMSTLITAKKENDLLTIVDLYNTHVNEEEITFTDAELSKINIVLKKKLRTINNEFEQIKYKTPQTEWIFENLYGRTEKVMERNITQVVKDTKERVKHDEITFKEIKTLKGLKPHLEARYERHNPFNFLRQLSGSIFDEDDDDDFFF